jgi:hypothetical protein
VLSERRECPKRRNRASEDLNSGCCTTGRVCVDIVRICNGTGVRPVRVGLALNWVLCPLLYYIYYIIYYIYPVYIDAYGVLF